MKRLYISQALKVQWQDVHLSKQKGKPHAVDHRGAPIAGIDFNVSHQNGLVALVGRKPVQSNETTLVVGVDITCVNERNDHHRIKEKDIDRWIDAYASVSSNKRSRGHLPAPLAPLGPMRLDLHTSECSRVMQ